MSTVLILRVSVEKRLHSSASLIGQAAAQKRVDLFDSLYGRRYQPFVGDVEELLCGGSIAPAPDSFKRHRPAIRPVLTDQPCIRGIAERTPEHGGQARHRRNDP